MTSRRPDVLASGDGPSDTNKPKRATVDFEPDLHQALLVRATASHRSISARVNEAVRVALAEDGASWPASVPSPPTLALPVPGSRMAPASDTASARGPFAPSTRSTTAAAASRS